MNTTWMRFGLGGVFFLGLGMTPANTGKAAPPLPSIVLYKSALCGCCAKWADHLRAAGFRVIVKNAESLTTIEDRFGVPKGLTSCHTALVGGYVVVGHVPADVLQRLLAERPAVAGISAPGMPGAAPGMDQANGGPYNILVFDRGGTSHVYATR